VKSVIGGELQRCSRSEVLVLATRRRLCVRRYFKAFFKTEREWRLSLPNNGSVTVTPYLYGAVERDWNAIKPEMSDPEKLQQLMKRFSVRATVCTDTPPQKMYELAKERVAKSGSSKDNVGNWMERNVRSWETHIATMTEEQKNYARPSIRNTCTGRMLLSTGDMVCEIAVEEYKGKLYIVNEDGKRYEKFADMDCLNTKGQPKLTVYYRKKHIGLANLF
jgi:NAD-dependent dihydropyrimidine dehydrogenase PreA subunit